MKHRAINAIVAALLLPAAAWAASPSTKPAESPDKPSVKRDSSGNPESSFMAQHNNIMASKAKGPYGVIFLGDSITANWRKAKSVWDSNFGQFRPANFGIGGDGTHHMLWRIDQGELDGLSPKVVVLLAGGNNLRWNATEVTAGVKALIDQVQKRLPESKILLLGILPRGFDPNDTHDKKGGNVPVARAKSIEINKNLASYADGDRIRYLYLGDIFLDDKGFISPDLMADALHPTAKAYATMAERMKPIIETMMK